MMAKLSSEGKSTMSSWLIALVGLIYLGIGVDQINKGQLWMGLTFIGYAFSNVGLYMMAK